jgi:hypothetical protein
MYVYKTLSSKNKDLLKELFFDDLFELYKDAMCKKSIKHINKRIGEMHVKQTTK